MEEKKLHFGPIFQIWQLGRLVFEPLSRKQMRLHLTTMPPKTSNQQWTIL